MRLQTEFKIALLISNMTYNSFAHKHGVSKQLISQLLTGKTQSKRIEKIIRDFTNKQMILMKKYLAGKYNKSSLPRQVFGYFLRKIKYIKKFRGQKA